MSQITVPTKMELLAYDLRQAIGQAALAGKRAIVMGESFGEKSLFYVVSAGAVCDEK